VRNNKEIVSKLHAAAKEYKMEKSIFVFRINPNLIEKINKLAGQNDVETDTLVETILSKYVHSQT
jgi:predicted HicB family RNase H-like nuclease